MLQSRFLSGGLGPPPDLDLVKEAQPFVCKKEKLVASCCKMLQWL